MLFRSHFHLLTLIQPVCGTRSDGFSVLARILPFPDTLSDSTIFWSSHRVFPFSVLAEEFFDTCTYSTFSQYLLGFYHVSLLTLIRPFSGTRPDSFSILTRILPFFVTHTDSTRFRYSPGQFFGTRTDSTFSRYLPKIGRASCRERV